MGRLILITLSCFTKNYYNLREHGLSILALGNWKSWMAPPSIVEFILTLVLREAIISVSPTLQGSVHLGTKGCLCDFSASLEDTKFKVLDGFVCSYCRAALQTDGFAILADELVHQGLCHFNKGRMLNENRLKRYAQTFPFLI